MNILIIGGGITGLSAAWFAKQKYPDAKITLFEKEGRIGGRIRTAQQGGFFFEKGPRTFQLGRSPRLLEMIGALKLEIIKAEPQKRYIYSNGKLRSLVSFLPRFIPYFIRELFVPPSTLEDESIYDFAARRFSPKIAETFFDPMTLGIYGGDIRKLSIRSCFPTLYDWEQKKGSVLKGAFSSPKKEKGLFTIKNGIQTLIEKLEKELKIEVILNCPAEQINSGEVYAGGKIWQADRVISALPPNIEKKSLWVVNVAYEQDVLSKKGFGYLVPSKEKSPLLGVVFDSCIFPEQSKRNETRLTCMLREGTEEPLKTVLENLEKHLKIRETPVYTDAFLAQNAIPQYLVGCRMKASISVEDCIERAFQIISTN